MQMMLAPEANLYPVPDDISDTVAAQFSVCILTLSRDYTWHDMLFACFTQTLAMPLMFTAALAKATIVARTPIKLYEHLKLSSIYAGNDVDGVCPAGGSEGSHKGQMVGADSRGIISGTPDHQPGQAQGRQAGQPCEKSCAERGAHESWVCTSQNSDTPCSIHLALFCKGPIGHDFCFMRAYRSVCAPLGLLSCTLQRCFD